MKHRPGGHGCHRTQGRFASAIIICDDRGEPTASYPIPSLAHIVVAEGDRIVAGTLMAKTPRKTSKTKDITGGYRASPSCSRLAGRRMLPRFPRLRAWWISVQRSRQALHCHQRPADWCGRAAPHPHWQTRHRLQGAITSGRVSSLPKARWTRTRFLTSAARRNFRSTWSTKSRKSIGCRA